MDRKTLTHDVNGVRRDFIPYVDDLAVMIGGTNLRDYLAQIEGELERASLFLGAFSSEEALLNKYPNGTELEVGTYAIVSDEDALYIYDTDSARWLKTASATIGVLQLNGLSPINGALTITGGDIDATVSEAENPTMKITAHLNELYAKSKGTDSLKGGLVALDYGISPTVEENDYIVYKATVGANYKNAPLLLLKLRKFGSGYINSTKLLKLNVAYSDGTSRETFLCTADGQTLTYNTLNNSLNLAEQPYVLVSYDDYRDGYFRVLNVYKKRGTSYGTLDQTLSSSNWIENEEGNGYKQVIEFNSYQGVELLTVYKTVDGVKTTAVYDYQISGKVLTVYSEERFTGTVIIRYAY